MNTGPNASRAKKNSGGELLPGAGVMPADLHFLLVNDDPNMRIVLIALLKELGYLKVSEAEHGEMALRAFKTAKSVGAPINFVITDCAMPLMNGLNLIRAIRQDLEIRDIPILMISAQATEEDILAAAEAGADGYIVRPFNASSLGKKLESILAAKIPADSTQAFQ